MSKNKIFKTKEIKAETLRKIYQQGNHLEELDLSGCLIRKLPDNMFYFLPNIRYVDLRHNFLITLPDSLAFHQNIEVTFTY